MKQLISFNLNRYTIPDSLLGLHVLLIFSCVAIVPIKPEEKVVHKVCGDSSLPYFSQLKRCHLRTKPSQVIVYFRLYFLHKDNFTAFGLNHIHTWNNASRIIYSYKNGYRGTKGKSAIKSFATSNNQELCNGVNQQCTHVVIAHSQLKASCGCVLGLLTKVLVYLQYLQELIILLSLGTLGTAHW